MERVTGIEPVSTAWKAAALVCWTIPISIVTITCDISLHYTDSLGSRREQPSTSLYRQGSSIGTWIMRSRRTHGVQRVRPSNRPVWVDPLAWLLGRTIVEIARALGWVPAP